MSDADQRPRKELFEVVTKLVDREVASADTLGARAAALIGFCGVILALSATLGRNALDAELGSVGEDLAVVALVGALVVILLAAVLAVTIMVPKPRGRPKPSVLSDLRSAGDADAEIFDRLTWSSIVVYTEEAATNDRRARTLRWAYFVLTLGLVLVALAGVVVALGGKKEACPNASPNPTSSPTSQSPSPSPNPRPSPRASTRTSCTASAEAMTAARIASASNRAAT